MQFLEKPSADNVLANSEVARRIDSRGAATVSYIKFLVIRVKPWDFFLAFCQIEFSAEEQNAHAVIFE